MMLFLLFATVVFLVMNTYYYFLFVWKAENELNTHNLRAAAQKVVVTPVIVEMLEDNDWDDDRPTVVGNPKNYKV